MACVSKTGRKAHQPHYKKMLNQRQELFVQQLITGKSATEAAIIAGYSEKTAQEQSSRLLSNVMICERLAALQTAVATGNIATVSKRKEILTEIAQDDHRRPITAQDKVRAISELNKMEGDYAPEKHLSLGAIEITIKYEDKE